MRKDYENQISKLKKQLENEKKAEIEALTKFYIDKVKECEETFELELLEKVNFEKARMQKHFHLEVQEKVQDALESKQFEFEFMQDQFMHRLKVMENYDETKGKSQDFAFDVDDDIESQFKAALKAKSSEYERKLQQYLEESHTLRKENAHLKQKLLETQSKIEASSLTGGKDSENSYIISLNQKYNDLSQSYQALKFKQEQTLKSPNMPYCAKCKAFVNTDSQLTQKISRLREFLSS